MCLEEKITYFKYKRGESMFCKNCGKEFDNETKYCPVCGQTVEDEESYTTSFASGTQSPKTKTRSVDYNKQTTLGVLALVSSSLNYIGVPFTHMIGIILGAVVINMISKEKKSGTEYSSAGYITGIIGLILGVIAFVYGFITGLNS
jgi:hypothetical protein